MSGPSKEVEQSWHLAQQLRAPWEPRWQRLVDLAMPYRTSFFQERKDGIPQVTIYDETGLTAIEEMANRLQTGVIPSGVHWAQLEPWQGYDQKQRAGLRDVQDELFRVLDRSNFADQANDAFKDLCGIGGGCMRLLPGDWMQPLHAMAIPLPDVWITPGANGRWADIHVRYRLPRYAVKAQWPDAELPREAQSAGRSDDRMTVIDSWIRNLASPVEHWRNEVHIDCKHLLRSREEEGAGSCHYVFGRWASVAGEIYGVGQGMVALPAIETVNEVRRQILAMGEIAMAGMWQAEDDGVLNPWAVQLEPGVIIPIAPGSRGLMPLQHPGTKIDLGLMELQEQRQSIKKALYNETLGPREGTPPTAFEVQQRMQELLRQIGPAYHRVWNELVTPILIRVRRILVDQGRIQLPLIDGKRLRIVASSSLVKAQAIGEVERVKQWAADIGGLFGPQAVATLVPADRFAAWAADKYDVPPGLPYTAEEIQQNAARTGKMLAEAENAGADLTPLLGALGKGA